MELSEEEKLVAYIANPYLDYHPNAEIDKIPLEFIEKNRDRIKEVLDKLRDRL